MGVPRILFPKEMGGWLLGAISQNEKGSVVTIWDKTLLLCTRNRKTADEALLVPGI